MPMRSQGTVKRASADGSNPDLGALSVVAYDLFRARVVAELDTTAARVEDPILADGCASTEGLLAGHSGCIALHLCAEDFITAYNGKCADVHQRGTTSSEAQEASSCMSNGTGEAAVTVPSRS